MKKLFKNILFDTLLFGIIFALLLLFNYFLGLMFRLWVYYVVAAIVIIGLIAGVIQKFKNSSSKITKIVLTIISIAIVVVAIIGWKIILLAVVFSYKPEHVVEKDGKKYVAYVNSFLNVDVYYYDYKNFFLMGNKIKLKEYYGKGGYDPFDDMHSDREALFYYYYDDSGKIVNTNNTDYTKVHNDGKIYYEIKSDKLTNNITKNEDNNNKDDNIYWIDNSIAYKVIDGDAAMGSELNKIYRTEDAGQTWQLQSNIVLHYNSKFAFINDNLSFIYDPGKAGVETEYGTLKVSTNSANSYIDCTIEHPKSISEKYLIVDEVPIYENNQLKLKVHTLNHIKNPAKTYYEYTSKDGITWQYSKKID